MEMLSLLILVALLDPLKMKKKSEKKKKLKLMYNESKNVMTKKNN